MTMTRTIESKELINKNKQHKQKEQKKVKKL